MLPGQETAGEVNPALEVNETNPRPAYGLFLTSASLTNHKPDLTPSADVNIDSAVTSVSSASTASNVTPLSTVLTSSTANTLNHRVTSSSMDTFNHDVTSPSAPDGKVTSLPTFPLDHGATSDSAISFDPMSSPKFSQPMTSSPSMAALVYAYGSSNVTSGGNCPLWRKLVQVFSPRQAFEELCDSMFWHDVIVETVLCMYYECLIIWISVTFDKSIYKPSITHFGLYAGFFVFACIEGWGPLCGASVNPARTWAVFLAGRMTFIKALVYTIVEVGGAAAGTMIGYGLTPANATNQITALVPGAGVTALQGMAIEAILTFNLIFVGLVLGRPSGQPSAITSLTIGFCVGTGVMAAGTHTGGLQNPIVAFGPAIISGNFRNHWLYWVGPYVGATVATVFYLLLKVVRDAYESKAKTPADVENKQDARIVSTHF